MDERTWEVNAQEFKELDRGNGWPFAILVACSVEKRKPGGRVSFSDRRVKVSAKEFAEAAGTGPQRISRILAAWQKCAERGLVPDARTLTPSDVGVVEAPDIAWSKRDAKADGEYVYHAPASVKSTPAVPSPPAKADKPQPVAKSKSTAKPESEVDPEPVREMATLAGQSDDVIDQAIAERDRKFDEYQQRLAMGPVRLNFEYRIEAGIIARKISDALKDYGKLLERSEPDERKDIEDTLSPILHEAVDVLSRDVMSW